MYWKMRKGSPTMLTAKQENFAEFLSKGTSQTSAYKGAYNTQNMSNKTV